MKTEDFQKLKDRIEIELKVTEDNVMEKSIQLSNLYSMVLKIYSKELKSLKEKKLEIDRCFGINYAKYKNEGYNGRSVESIKEAEIYIFNDNQYYQLKLEFSQIETQVNFLEKTLTHIDNLGFRIKNFVDLKKMKLGLL